MKKKDIKTIAILGLTYKAKTNSIKNSPSLLLVNKLKHKYNINIFDPVIKKIDSLKIKFANSIYESIKGATVWPNMYYPKKAESCNPLPLTY